MSDALSIQLQQQLVLSSTGPTSVSPDLDAVIVEILSWLPPKSLLRFRCVCKTWRALISDPYFIRQHLSRVTNSNSYSILFKQMSTYSFRCMDSEPLFKADGPMPTKELYCPVTDSLIDFNNIEVVGSCNGLICLGLGRFSSVVMSWIMLWNPSTRESKELPKPPPEVFIFYPETNLLHFSIRFYGFGYDSTTDDYKVVIGDLRRTSGQGAGYEYIVFVYTVRTGVWRKLQPVSNRPDLFGRGCLVNNALYWVHDKEDEYVVGDRLVSFNLAEEKFHEIAIPDYPIEVERCIEHLAATQGKFRNSLASCVRRTELDYMMLVMKDPAVGKSWNQVIKMPKEVLPVPGDHEFITWKPLSISGDSIALIEVCDFDVHDAMGFLTLYNPKENRCINVSEHCVSESVTYVETLVSPFLSTGM